MNKENFEYFYEIKKQNEKLQEQVEDLQAEIAVYKAKHNTYERCLSRLLETIKRKYGVCISGDVFYRVELEPIINEEKEFMETIKKKTKGDDNE